MAQKKKPLVTKKAATKGSANSKKKKSASKNVEKSKQKDSAGKPKKAKKRVYKINSGLKLYNKLNKALSQQNAKLPDNLRLTYAQRRKILSDDIYKHFKGVDPKFINIKAIREYIDRILENVNLGIGDPRYLPPSCYGIVPYYQLDSFIIDTLMPFVIDMRVNATTEYGITKIFNTGNYEYSKTGVHDIVEALRALELDSSNLPEFGGVVMIKPNHKDDNKGSSYYLDMRVIFKGEQVEIEDDDLSEEAEEFKPKTKKEIEDTKSIKRQIDQKIKELTQKKLKKKKKEAKAKVTEPAKKIAKPKIDVKEQVELVKETNLYIKNMQKLYSQKLISKKDMQIAMKNAISFQVPQPTKVPKKIMDKKKIVATKKVTATKKVVKPSKKTVPKKKK